MPEIAIRPALSGDIEQLANLEHHYTSECVWQIDVQSDDGQIQITLRESCLPRSVRVDYPHSPKKICDDWQERAGLLVALLNGNPIGYISIRDDIVPQTAWVDDLVVMRRMRRQGVGTALLLAAQQWANQRQLKRMVIEMQSKNYPAICLAQKLGFDFSGYHERYFSNLDIALFFSKVIG
jgi:ribosomal protein S18 acetylase RimI-like enzyme